MGVETGGTGSEGIGQEKPEVQLPPDIEQEKKEIEASLEPVIKDIEGLCRVFGFQYEEFSDDQDRSIADSINRLNSQIEANDSGKILFRTHHGQSFDQFGTFIENGEIRFNDPPNPWLGNISHEVRLYGRMETMSDCNYLFPQIGAFGRAILTKPEHEAFEDFEVDRDEFSEIEAAEGRLVYLAIRKRSEQDEDAKRVVDETEALLREYGEKESTDPFLVNSLLSMISRKYGEDVAKRTFEKFQRRNLNLYSSVFEKAYRMRSRFTMHLALLYAQRAGYLAELAKTDSPAFREVQEKSTESQKVYEVDPDFQFTEEDARKAKELNLPWSKIEKEKGKS